MTMRLGRLELPDPEEWKPGRDEVRLAGLAVEPGELGYEGLIALADSLTALADNLDEPVIPVTTLEAEGYYAVESIDVDPGAVGLSVGVLEYEARLRPVEPRRRPLILSALTQTAKSNVNGVSAVAAQHAVPAGVDAWSWLPAATAQQETRPTAPGPAGGDVLYRRAVSGTGQTEARWWADPAAYYGGSCHALQRFDKVDVPVVGRSSLSQPWRIGNGLVEVSLTPGGRIAARWWMPGGRWTPTYEFAIGSGGGFSFTSWVAAEVTQLSAQQITVRAQAVRAQGRSTLWLTLRRGSRTISSTIDTDALPGHSVKPATSTPTTDEVFDAWQTTATTDSGGMHYVITAADDFAVNTTTGEVSPANALAPTWSFGLGAYFDGAGGDSGSRDLTMRDWYAARSEQVQIG